MSELRAYQLFPIVEISEISGVDRRVSSAFAYVAIEAEDASRVSSAFSYVAIVPAVDRNVTSAFVYAAINMGIPYEEHTIVTASGIYIYYELEGGDCDPCI